MQKLLIDQVAQQVLLLIFVHRLRTLLWRAVLAILLHLVAELLVRPFDNR